MIINPLVHEVIVFLEQGQLLHPSPLSTFRGATIEHNLDTAFLYLREGTEKAIELASDPEEERFEELVATENYPLWWILDTEKNNVYKTINSDQFLLINYNNKEGQAEYGALQKRISELLHRSINSLRQSFPNHNSVLLEAVPYVEASLLACAFSRFFIGTQNLFFEKMLQMFLQGGWPYGWQGHYPEGDLLVLVLDKDYRVSGVI
ncbi:hypothetical protein [Armatimonas sp.]|uniref:hypothetical protein n=1 Tax=Armatimonas sp. TaxID=1872638 RepID=UPI00374DB380